MLAGIVASMVFLSCKDNFNEQNFLLTQAKLKRAADSAALVQKNTAAAAFAATQVAALNSAGQLLSFTVQVQEDRAPLAGVAVSLANTSGTTAITSATTDANGNAVFINATIGAVTVTISKAGYATAEAIINLGTVVNNNNYTTVSTTGPNGTATTQIIPIKQSVSAVIPIFATTGTSSTATIKGNVQIETDLTNTTFEIPQNVTLTAGFTGAAGTAPASASFTAVGNNNSATATIYNFAAGSNGGFGVGVVNNTTGAYSITVPASSIGTGLPIVVTGPVVTANQTLWINSTGTIPPSPAPVPIKRTDIPGTFTLDGSAPDVIPVVAGATAAFNIPSVAGSGFSFTFTVVPKLLDGGTISGPSATTIGNTGYQLTSRGAGYTSPPTVTVSGASTTATAGPQMNFYATGLTVTNVGAGYTPSTGGTIDLAYTNGSGDQVVNSINFTTTAGGTLPAIVLPTSGIGFTSTSQAKTINSAVTAFKFNVNGPGVPTTAAVITGTFLADVNGVYVNAGSTTYSAAPTFIFAGGGAATQATFGILEFKTQWYATPTNASTTPYKIMPSAIGFSFPTTSYFGAQLNDNNINWETNGINDPTPRVALASFTTDGTNLVSLVPTVKFRTNIFWGATPATSVVSVNIKATITTPSLTWSGGTTITGLGTATLGSGYDVAPAVTITVPAGAPGTGAAINLSGGITFSNTTKIFAWDGSTLTVTPGTGYLQFLNRQSTVTPTTLGTTTTVTTKPGQVYILDLKYGTGKRTADIYN